MAYQNISFPTLRLVHGFIEEIEAPTSIISNFVKEYRINRYANTKSTFIYQTRVLLKADIDVILGFLNTVGWQRDSFNFTSPLTGGTYKVRLDNMPSAQVIALNHDNSPKLYQLSEIKLKQVFNE